MLDVRNRPLVHSSHLQRGSPASDPERHKFLFFFSHKNQEKGNTEEQSDDLQTRWMIPAEWIYCRGQIRVTIVVKVTHNFLPQRDCECSTQQLLSHNVFLLTSVINPKFQSPLSFDVLQTSDGWMDVSLG